MPIRLPIPGQDTNTWGDILNNYLLVAHTNEGTLRGGSIGTTHLQPNAVTTPTLADNSVTTPKVADSSITQSKLHPDIISQLQSVGISPSDQAKLDGIAPGATANSSDSQLRDRTTHTGTQPISSITNLQTELNAKANTADLATVATSGNYNDLTNRPTIPPAQVNADWNASTGTAQILNKPTIPDVSNLATTTALTDGLNGKADVGHGHAAADVTSGVFTANRLPVASDTASGIVELATIDEAETGTDTTHAVTPAGVKAAIDAAAATAPAPGQIVFVDSLNDLPPGTPVDTLVVVRAS